MTALIGSGEAIYVDNKRIQFGSGPDIEIKWNGTYLQSGQADTSKMWNGCPSAIDPDPTLVFRWINDFLGGVDSANLWNVQTDGSGAMSHIAADGGWAQATTDTTQHNETYGGMGDGTGATFAITASSGKKRWASVRGMFNSNSALSGFFGWAKPSAVTANFLADSTGAIGDHDCIGLVVRADTPTAVDLAYRANGKSEQEQVGVATNSGMAAVKLDLYFDGDTTLKVWVNDVAQTDITVDSNFPNGVAMMPFIGVKTNGAIAKSVKVDYFMIAGER